MKRRQLILGPPGTGKTTACVAIVSAELAGGTPPGRIAYVTFGRAATEDVRARVIRERASTSEMAEAEFPWVRTVHSTAFRLLGLSPDQVMGAGEWGEFGQRYGYTFTGTPSLDDGRVIGPTRTVHDTMRALHDWGRNQRLGPAKALARSPLRVDPAGFLQFVARYTQFKQERRRLDFVDMLEEVLAQGLRPPVDVAIVDEAQDLSPLQVAVVNAWFTRADRVHVAGDDDQSIYEFQGADSSWLQKFAGSATVRVLGQSFRVPKAVHAVAQAIIGQNRQRIAKTYLPRAGVGRVETSLLDVAMRGLDPAVPALVLARNRCFLAGAATELRRLGVPHIVEGGPPSPFDPGHGLAQALRAGLALRGGHHVRAEDLKAMLRFVPSRGVIAHGVKAKVDREPSAKLLTPADVGMLCGAALVASIKDHGAAAVLQGASKADLDHVQQVFARHGSDVMANIRLTTVHRAKGREAETVVVLPDMTKATFIASRDARDGGSDAENRVAYVAVTRSRDRLILVMPNSKHSFPYPRR